MNEDQIYPLSDEIIQRVTAHRMEALNGVVKVDPAKLARDYLDLNRARELFGRIRSLIPAQGGRMLELGSGFGTFVAYAARWENVQVFGIEPNPDSAAICRQVQKEVGLSGNRITRAVGENLPFPSESMDLVYSITVLEHVTDPARVLAEAVRVLKPGGYLHFTFPNYGSWWEGHYAILWLPNMPKWFARIYVRLLGRKPHFLKHLQLINYRRLMKYLAPLRDQIEVMEVGQTIWEERLRTAAFSEWAQLSKLKSWVRLLHRLHLVDVIIWLGRRLHWETPFVLVLRKKA
jgi:SAM-dependent methyltransferase